MDERAISQKISNARVSVLQEHPFFGRLLLKLRYGLAECGTAFTDMQRIIFDKDFAQRLSAQEVEYVLVHEVLHCALKHCTRGIGKQQFIYNVACDIVVNSTIMEMYHKDEIIIDGNPMMHLAPDGNEGGKHSAEEIYTMLMKMSPREFDNMYGGGSVDNHDAWNDLDCSTLEDLWNHHLKDVVNACGIGNGIPDFLTRYLKEIDHNPRTNWRQILHDFIQFDTSDYNFSQPDKRYSADIILPSFCENIDGCSIKKLWFFVDTSGSVSDETLFVAYKEIMQATMQINLSGMLSFFDYKVSDPTPFESFEDILSIKPVGGGGTSFYAIFKKIEEYANEEELPNVIVIITDGYASFPKEEAALGVPVIWIIVDSDVVPPWGAYTFISN